MVMVLECSVGRLSLGACTEGHAFCGRSGKRALDMPRISRVEVRRVYGECVEDLATSLSTRSQEGILHVSCKQKA